jgi:response regulator RpfG family c-di-GMP phosphodiesterase
MPISTVRGDVVVLSPDREVLQAFTTSLSAEPYRVVPAATVDEGLQAVRSASAELLVVDTYFKDPLELITKFQRANPALGFMLVIGDEDAAIAVDAARRGIVDFVIRPVDVHKTAVRIRVALEKHSLALEDRAYTVALEERLNVRTEEVVQSRERIKSQFISTIHALEKALQAKNVYTEGHSRRVAEKSVEIARAMGVPRDQIRHIELAALFHDIGKIGIRDSVLNKNGKLTDSEYEHMKIHPVVAEQILSPIEELRPIVEIVKHEHERWDGQGYPGGLQGAQIPLGSRVIAIADAWDSMVFDRVYRKALPHEQALREIEKNSGVQFDPDCVKMFCDLERRRLAGGGSPTPSPAASSTGVR